ncbi:MAG: D-alanyl-D-alanine carboxypeptidase/D-alanyl-D-alanine-endopeptidase [Armatimonadetes bacterium]|nr:D-alanyl-D-alanine carboxypeptidase/D-alanyl-D-alanine-endopeptidase [Armatimonadota bacterium]
MPAVSRWPFALFSLILLPHLRPANLIANDLNDLFSSHPLPGATVGVMVQSLLDGQVYYRKNADADLMPASNLKLLVSAAALHWLGPAFRYQTQLLYTGKITSRGVLEGNLILKGSGDPSLSTADLIQLANRVKRDGIHQISGRIVLDNHIFDDRRIGYGWECDDLPYYYAAGIDGLNVNHNLMSVQVLPGRRADDPVRVLTKPLHTYFTVVNHAVTVQAGDPSHLVVTRKLGRDVLVVSGQLAMNLSPNLYRPTVITVNNPTRYIGLLFRHILIHDDVRGLVNRSRNKPSFVIGTTPVGAKPLATHYSVALSRLLQLMNRPSDDFIAECLLKTVGTVVSHKGSDPSGIADEMSWFSTLELPVDQINVVDGSGLSRHDLVTPHFFCDLLSDMRFSSNVFTYVESLPVAGQSGTLKYRMHGTLAAGNCTAKTGSLDHVSTLSGYVTTKDGEPLCFSILLNNFLTSDRQAERLEDRVVEKLAEIDRFVSSDSHKAGSK